MTSTVVGRDEELARLDRATSVAGAGRALVVGLRGAIGLGRSTLLDAVRARAEARGMAVLSARGRAADAELGFSSLLTLLRPVDHRLDELAGSEAPELRAALALDRRGADPVAVRLAALQVVAGLAAERPLVLLLDDAARFDRSSADVLAFVLGRLGADAVLAVVVSAPDDTTTFDDLLGDVVDLGPLGADAMAEVLAAGGDLAPEPLARCVALAAGNPLAALALAAALTPDQRRGSAPLPTMPRPSGVLATALAERLAREDEAVRRALVVVAADDTGERALVVEALARLGEPVRGLDDAEAAGLVVVAGDRLDVAHPLLRPVAYHQVAPASRRAAHRALAAACAGPEQGASRAWQLVAAAEQPDEDLAASLELVAVDAARRGAPASAARTLACAAALSPSIERRRHRLALAAQHWLAAGDGGAAGRLGDQLLDLPVTGGSLSVATLALRGRRPAAEVVARTQVALAAAEPEERSVIAAVVAAELLAAGARTEAARLAASVGEVALARAVLGAAGSAPTPQDLLAALPPSAGHELQRARALAVRTAVAGGHHAAVLALDLPALALGGIELHLAVSRAAALLAAGERQQAADALERLAAVVPPGAGAARADLDLQRAEVALAGGELERAASLAGAVHHEATALGLGALQAAAGGVLGRRALADGEPAAALALVRQAAAVDPTRWSSDLAVAAAACGLPAEAARAAEAASDGIGHLDPAVDVVARCAAGVAGDESQLRSALDRATEADLPLLAIDVVHARAEAAQRAGDRTTVRRLAAELRARRAEMGARGGDRRGTALGRGDPQLDVAADVLTPAEHRVAVAVAEGRTNRAAADALFVSVKTVDFHLQNIYRKLAVRSRTELAVRLHAGATGPGLGPHDDLGRVGRHAEAIR